MDAACRVHTASARASGSTASAACAHRSAAAWSLSLCKRCAIKSAASARSRKRSHTGIPDPGFVSSSACVSGVGLIISRCTEGFLYEYHNNRWTGL